MSEILAFGEVVLVVAAALVLALVAHRLTRWFPVPGPALFLGAAALAAYLFPHLAAHISIRNAERIAVVALILILFDGGMEVGWRRFRRAALPISALGVVGTFATGVLLVLSAHYVFDIGWTTSAILGAALCPTDPAVMFSILGNREVGGRSGTILEGESGANDPVSIALMGSVLDYTRGAHGSALAGVGDFALAMGVGAAIGVGGALLLRELMRRTSLPSEGLYPLRTLAAALAVYGIATVAHGSGFLAVFIAGLVVGDTRAPYKVEVERFHKSLASLGEIAVFTVLGLTVQLSVLGRR